MQKKILITIVLFLVLLFNNNVYAECTYKDEAEVSAYATNIKTGYSVIDEYEGTYCSQSDPTDCTENQYSGFHFVVYINNLNDKIYAEVTEDLNNTTKKYYYTESNKGNISIISNYKESKINYKIVIKALNGNCSEKVLRTKTVTTPKYNRFSAYAICYGIEDYYLCQRFYDFDITEDEFFEKTRKYKEDLNSKEDTKKEDTNNKTISNFLKDNYIIISISSFVVISIIIIIVIKRRKRRIV